MEDRLPATLEGLLLESQRLYRKVSDADFDDDTDRDNTIARAKVILRSLQEGVTREGVFSSNEDLEEIATQALPLLAANFYLGSLMMKLPFTNPEVRLKVLDQAEALLFKYLDTCDRLELFEEADGQVWQSMSKDGERFASGGRQIMTRDKKIERFRRKNKIQQRMKAIEDELKRAEGKDCEDESEDDGMRRERSLLLLASLATDALDEVSGISKVGRHMRIPNLDDQEETEMLKHLAKAREDGVGREGYGARAARHGDAANRSAGLEVTHISSVGGSLQIRKEDVRADVFKPTVALPTMTVEEFGEIELERARERQEESNGEQTSSRRRYEQLEKDGDEDDEELVQQAAKYDREWDDWKDANPRGSGNKANKNI